MPDKSASTQDRLDRIEAAQEDLLAAATKLESRLDIFHQEFRRVATAVQRLGLAGERDKTAAQRRDETLDEVRRQLARIEAVLSGR